jgi:Zn-dependent peptidase ImmA (M78 family)/transcriptional regulator with XRE-family HTH domain
MTWTWAKAKTAAKKRDDSQVMGTGSGQLTIFGGGSAELNERIKRLRLVRRWDQLTLARKTGVPQTAISRIESGRLTPTAEHLEAIAFAFGYSPEFLKSELRLAPTTRPWLRAYADASKREADARTAATTLAVEYIRTLRLRPLPDLIPEFGADFGAAVDSDDAIEEAAAEVRQAAQIDHGAVVTNAMRAAERLGCLVLPLESELGRHVGMSVRSDDLPIMSVAKAGVPGDRQRWTVAHELGHLVLHGQAPPPRDGREAHRMEAQAHRFAGAFLCPAEPLLETLSEKGGKVTLRSLAEIKAEWGVAIKALVHRFQDLGTINPEQARSLYKQISSRKWTKTEPVEVPTESAQWLERTLVRKGQASGLSEACAFLASSVGGNPRDLLSFADWSPGTEAEVVKLADRRRN